MRIISGKHKGFSLYLAEKEKTRPLKDRVRQSVFNMLEHSNKILFQLEGAKILDLYAGTGSFGLECLSRKSKFVYFVENEKNTRKILEKNIRKLKLDNKAKIFFKNVFELIEKKFILKEKFDLIFCDPPFKDMNIEKLIELIFERKILNQNGVIILHRNKNSNDKMIKKFNILDERIYGISKIVFGNFLN